MTDFTLRAQELFSEKQQLIARINQIDGVLIEFEKMTKEAEEATETETSNWLFIMSDTLTAEEIAHNYYAAGHSVSLINKMVVFETLTEEEVDRVDRNVRHLEIMVAKDYWTTEDLEPLNSAITAGKAKIA